MSNTTQLSAIFKEVYDTGSQVFEAQQNLKAPSWKRIKKSPYKPSAQGVQMPVSMSGNENGSAINENQGFQTPGSLNPVRPTVLSKLVVWPFEVTGSAIRLSETDAQSFANALDAQQKDNMGRMMSDLNRQTLGTGTGQMALLTANVVANNVITVDQITPFRRGQILDIYVAFGGAPVEVAFTVTAVDFDNSQITVDRNITANAGEAIAKTTVFDGAPADGKELGGLRLICDDGTIAATYEGVAIATEPEWVGNIISAGVAPISQDLLQRTAYRQFVVGGNDGDLLISNVGQARNFLNTETVKVRYRAEEIKGGHDVLTWNTKEWVIDKDYPFGEVGIYDSNYVERFENKDVHLSQLDGNSVIRIQGFDKVAGYYVYQGNMGSWKRNAHARLIDLTEPAL